VSLVEFRGFWMRGLVARRRVVSEFRECGGEVSSVCTFSRLSLTQAPLFQT
jgi:hypothetical protein